MGQKQQHHTPYLHSRAKVSELSCDNINENSHVGSVEHASCTAAAKQVQQKLGNGIRTAGRGYGHRILCTCVCV